MSYLTLLHSTWPYLALLCPTWLYLALLHSTMALLGLLDSTTLYHHSTGIYLTLLHFGMALLDSTGLHYTLPWLYVALLLYYTLPWLYYNCVKSLWYHWPLPTTSWIETGVLLLSGFCLSGIEPKWVAVCWAGHVSQEFAVTNGVRQREGGIEFHSVHCSHWHTHYSAEGVWSWEQFFILLVPCVMQTT